MIQTSGKKIVSLIYHLLKSIWFPTIKLWTKIFSFESCTFWIIDSINELKITESDVFDDVYNGAASANKHKEIGE